MSKIKVSFEHYKFLITEELKSYNSGYFDNAERKAVLLEEFNRQSQLVSRGEAEFHRHQILCANEVFPEAAVANPLADLEVWNLWKSGYRRFPYPGTYRKFNITSQLPKTNSPSSVGVLGEIIAGLFGQAIISPFILVRPIRRFPDFIYSTNNGLYAYLESKAFTTVDSEDGLFSRVKRNELVNFLVESLREMVSDSHVKTWGSFTYIQEINPTKLFTTFIEVDFKERDKSKLELGIMPEPVIQGLAEIAIERGVAKMLNEGIINFRNQQNIETLLMNCAFQEVEALMYEFSLEFASDINYKSINKAITKLVGKVNYSELGRVNPENLVSEAQIYLEGRRFEMYDIAREQRLEVEERWNADWESATEKFNIDNMYGWRFSNKLFW
ncbi:MAG: hypothetical protein AAFV71_23165 [Cyanobacteria bacterium J06633_8]